jgi:hypothetical protein
MRLNGSEIIPEHLKAKDILLDYKCLYFKLAFYLKQKFKKFLIPGLFLIGMAIFLLGFLIAEFLSPYNYFLSAYYGLISFIDSQKSSSFWQLVTYLRESFDLLSLAYLIATLWFFLSSIINIPKWFAQATDSVDFLAYIEDAAIMRKFRLNIKSELSNCKVSIKFILFSCIMFFIGELIVITTFNHCWSLGYIIYYLSIPVALNGILLGTEIHLIKIINNITSKYIYDLPPRLFDLDETAGLGIAGHVLLKMAIMWLISIVLISFLFIMSNWTAGLLMFLMMFIISWFIVYKPMYDIHQYLIYRKRSILISVATQLNKNIELFNKKSTSELEREINILKEQYSKAQNLKVWAPRSFITGSIQFISIITPIIASILFK